MILTPLASSRMPILPRHETNIVDFSKACLCVCLATANPGLDNARYQKCRLVRDLALSLGIELLFLPTYSPNLNLIERLWKFVKKQCLYSIYYNDFAVFKQAISACLAQTNTVHKATLDSLLTLRFQTFSKSQIVRR